MDEHVYRHLLSFVRDPGTQAALCCTCRLFRDILSGADGARKCSSWSGLFGRQLHSRSGQLRARALFRGHYRRMLLADLQAARTQGLLLDSRPYAWDFSNLRPQHAKWLQDAHLLATDCQNVVLYNKELELLGVLSFHDGQVAAPSLRAGRPTGPRLFFGRFAMLLYKCPLDCGILYVEPPLERGAADYLGPWQLQQAMSAGGADSGVPGPVDDDVHLLRQALLREGLLASWRLLATPGSGLLTTPLVTQVVSAGRTLALRCLDVSGNHTLGDESLGQLLGCLPHLRILRAADSNFGRACLAALCGRAEPAPQSAQPQAPAGMRGALGAAGGTYSGSGSGGSSGHHSTVGHLSGAHTPAYAAVPRQHGQQPAAAARSVAAATEASTAYCCHPKLHVLDVCHSRRLASCAGLLPHMLCHQTALRDLRLRGVPGSGVILEAAQQLEGSREDGTRAAAAAAAALQRVLGQLTRLDLLDVDSSAAAGASTIRERKGSASGDSRHSRGGLGCRQAEGLDRTAERQRAAGRSTSGSCGSSSGTGLSWAGMEQLVQQCTSLRSLAIASRQLAAQQSSAGRLGRYDPSLPCLKDGAEQGEAGWPTVPGQDDNAAAAAAGPGVTAAPAQGSTPGLPSLLDLEVGWGTGGTFLWRGLLASPFLRSLTVHAGAAVGDWHLQQLAASCPYLCRLELRGANVSEAGVSCVLRHCCQLTSLQLHSCVGPLSDALAAPSSLPPRAPAFRLQELQLSWSGGQLTDQGLCALLHPEVATLRCLVLQGFTRLTDSGLWPALLQHSATLECLQLVHCGSLQAGSQLAVLLGASSAQTCAPGCSSSNGVGVEAPAIAAALPQQAQLAGGMSQPLTALAAVEALAACTRLAALTVRGSVFWDPQSLGMLRNRCLGLASAVLE